MEEFSLANHPGIAMDLLPFLRHFPSWFPGNRIKDKAKLWRADLEETVQVPFDMVTGRIVSRLGQRDRLISWLIYSKGEHSESYTADLLQRSPEKGFNIKWSAASMYGGGADTASPVFYINGRTSND